MTFALAIVFVALLLIYCGVKGRSFKDAVLGHALPGSTGQVTGS
jgi:hypothetical protein